MSIINELITDRTRSDVSRIERLISKGWDNMTEEERGYFLGLPGSYGVPLVSLDGHELYSLDGEQLQILEQTVMAVKGAYNASDLNRVTEAVEYLATRIRGYGNNLDALSGQGVWSMEDIPTSDSMRRYLDNVGLIRSSISVLPSTPVVPDDMEDLSVDEANDIEKVLVDVDFLLNNMEAAWLYSGDIYSGEVI